jgi:predicted  nucleic acid-binding Zn-ribbon protein
MKEMGKVIRDLRHKLKSAERHLDAMAVSSKKTIDDLKFEADGAKGEIVAFRRILSEHRTVEKDLTGKVETVFQSICMFVRL